MKSLMLNIMAVVAFVLLCGCTTVNWNLPQGFDPQHATADRLLIQVKPAEETGNHKVDPAIKKRLYEFLHHKFSSSARFVVLTGLQGDLTGTQNKFLQITPFLAYQREKLEGGNIYYCKVDILCQLLDLETGAHSNNGADDISCSGNSPIQIKNPVFWDGQEHFNVTTMDVDTMYNETFPQVWAELEKKIMEKFPVNARVTSVESTRSGTKVHINAGTSNGLRSSDLFKVYAVKNKMVTVVAMAKGLVGANDSTLTITKWNEDDATVRDIYIPQMMQNRADDLYVVAEPKKSQ